MQIFSQRESELRAILSSNLGLGGVAPGASVSQIRNRHRRLQAGLTQVASHAIEAHAGLVIIAGDLFAGPAPLPGDLLLAAQELGRLREHRIAVLAIPGDRDSAPDGGISPLDLLRSLHLLEVPPESQPINVQVGKLNLHVSSLPWHPGSANGGPLQRLDYGNQADFHLLVTHYPVEGMGGDGGREPCINLDSVRALLGVNVLVAGGGNRSAHGRAGVTTVAVPGNPGLADGTGGFLELDISRRGLERIDVIPGLGAVRRLVEIPASLLSEDDAPALIRGRIEPLLDPEAEILLRITGRTDPETLRTAGLAGVAGWAKSAAAGFELDLTGLRVGDDALDSGPGHLSPIAEMTRAVKEENAEDELSGEAGDMALTTLRRVLGARLDSAGRR